MNRVTHHAESMGNTPALYMALELGVAKWHIAFGARMGGPVLRRQVRIESSQTVGAVLTRLIADAKVLLGLPGEAPVRSCYEAGRDGFWVERLLASLGVDNCVVDSSSIEVNRRARQAKTDRLDAKRLLRMLLRYWAGERDLWHVCRVPSLAEEDARHATRLIATLTTECTRWRNRIHSALALHGVRLSLRRTFLAQLPQLRDWSGAPLPPGVIAALHEDWTQLRHMRQALRRARLAARRQLRRAATPAAQCARRVHHLRGVGPDTALTLAQEIFGRGVRNRRQVGALTGLIAVPHGSGERMHGQSISRTGNKHVRRFAVELAWAWVQWQPDSALTQWFQRRWAHGGARQRRIGIVAVARKLLIALWRYGMGGAVPQGALLRP
jgi:transposase